MNRSTVMPTLLVLIAATTSCIGADDLTPDELKFFETKIRPVLIKECYGCHSNKSGNVRGGLRLDTKELMAIGGSTGPAIVPGDLEESWLYNAITHQDYVMPPKRKLSANVIEDFRKWIEMGAPDPRTSSVAKINSTIDTDDINKAKKNFWAYKHPKTSTPPVVLNQAWVKTDVDKFVLAKLEHSELKPADDAEAAKVLRRLTFDLVGLPPTPQQIAKFESLWKDDPDAAIKLVTEKLLQQPQFGERWGRHWLDVARYAESTGSAVNMTYPHAWRYRDYVIDSFNEDKPFDQFVQEQLAGDLLPAQDDKDWSENLVATSFLAIGAKNVNEQNRVQFAANVADEQIDATTRVFMGTSVACARCHDHKFDPIPQTDYYAMAGVFANMKTYFGNPPSDLGQFSNAQTKQTSSLLLLPVDDPSSFDKSYSEKELAEMKQQISDLQKEMRALRSNRSQTGANSQRNRIRLLNQITDLNNKMSVVDSNGNPRSYTMGVQERGAGKDARLFVRGEIDQPAQKVPRGFPQVLCSADSATVGGRTSGRLEMARWVGSDQNPLTARVMVNRIWQHLIGKGIVTSVDNFGITGSAPSHPELLDYLAVRFVESKWSVKTIIREIVTSRVYRMSSEFDKKYHEFDPENAYVWRANPRRLDAEAIRDSILTVSGQIDLKRPRGSLVAQAGYTRVQSGVLGNARDIARKAFAEAAKELRSEGGGMRGGSGRGGQQGRRRAGQRRQRGTQGRGGTGRQSGMQGRGGRGAIMNSELGQRAARKVTNQLDMEEATFRSVYLPIVRDEEPRSLHVFDFADSSTITGTRESSSTANQALYMMNNPFVITQSEAFAERIAKQSSRPAEQINQAFLLAYGRKPTSGERNAAIKFVRSFASGADRGSRGADTLKALCQSLFASAEFRYID